MSKRVYFGGVALYVVALAFLLTNWLVRPPGVTEANVRRIQPGMTRVEVVALLGRGPDMEMGGWHPNLVWFADSGSATVTLSTNGLVMWAHWLPGVRPWGRRISDIR
ncbi:MAG TPA: hypothetical protein VEL76_18310 [Gemmataceae bacterium]|nr:hypothetical protein [Gemmataceae bacterium]